MSITELEKEIRQLKKEQKKMKKQINTLLTIVEGVPLDDNIEVIVSRYLRNLGVSPSLLGYTYLRDAIIRGISKEKIYPVTKVLYPNIAVKYDSTPTKVERAMRHAIEKTLLTGNLQEIEKLFRYVIYIKKDTITVSTFIATIVDEIQLSQKRTV